MGAELAREEDLRGGEERVVHGGEQQPLLVHGRRHTGEDREEQPEPAAFLVRGFIRGHGLGALQGGGLLGGAPRCVRAEEGRRLGHGALGGVCGGLCEGAELLLVGGAEDRAVAVLELIELPKMHQGDKAMT